ncbi:unnamed protein product [Notodromas monacha]|uniref:Uncharacterized protein n=1 Tax=Notodromas monacha TaxID=399045 RepID=A0A7R9BDK8_9CRUS|nr:unnamed protein product [Notodromas monacha]CAG0912286.1 unnamed protein product [Notodromas monacha]
MEHGKMDDEVATNVWRTKSGDRDSVLQRELRYEKWKMAVERSLGWESPKLRKKIMPGIDADPALRVAC